MATQLVWFKRDLRVNDHAPLAQAARNGVTDLRLLSRGEARGLEPLVMCDAALLSPSTGIVDSHALMLSLQGEIEEQGGAVLTHSRVRDVNVTANGFDVCLDGVGVGVQQAVVAGQPIVDRS